MPYSIARREGTLTVMVTDPVVSDVPRGLAEILRCLDEGGISLVLVGFDEAAWRTGWAENVLTAFEANARNLGVKVQLIGEDARLDPSRRGS